MHLENLKICRPKNFLLLPLLIIFFLQQLNGIQIRINYTSPNRISFFIVYKLGTWSRDLNTGFTLKDCLFGSVKLVRNTDPDKYVCTGYGIGFNLRSAFSLTDDSTGKNATIFGADMS